MSEIQHGNAPNPRHSLPEAQGDLEQAAFSGQVVASVALRTY